MAQGISLQKLMDQVKKELLATTSSPDYPLFLVDKIELELAVAITAEASGEIGVSVLDTVSAQTKGDLSRQYSHTVKVALTPILTREEIKALFDRDERLKKRIAETSRLALTRSGELEGTPE